MMTNMTRTWLKQNLHDVCQLAQSGVAVCKAILDARAQYNRTNDPRWLDNLTTNISTYRRWLESGEGKEALEKIRQPRPAAHTERRGAQRNKTQRIHVAKPAQRAVKQSKSGRVIR
jgi:hypothetical protein